MQREGIPLETAIKGITANPASILKLNRKGQLKPGFDGDVCLLTEDSLSLHTVIARGRVMVRDKKQQVFGTFEKS